MSTTYNADSFQKHEGRDAIRKRPGFYVAGTDSTALMHLIWEAIDNSVDESLAGYGDKITVTLHEDRSIQVDDAGRGIPTGINAASGESALEMAFDVHSGGKFDQESYSVSGGLFGVGIATVAALSTRATATVYRDKKKHVVEFKEGTKGVFSDEGEDAEFTPKDGITTSKDSRSTKEKRERPTGTSIRWYPDYSIFDDEESEGGKAEIDINQIIRRCQNTSYLRPELTTEIIDRTGAEEQVHTFHYPNGIQDMLGDMTTTEALNSPIKLQETSSFTSKRMDKEMIADIALQWEEGLNHQTVSFVNVVETSLGGTHVAGTLKGIEESVTEALHSKKLLKSKDPVPEQQDIIEGLNLVVSVVLPDPGYASATKERINEPAVGTAMRRIIKEYMDQWFSSRRNATEANAVLKRIITAARTRKARDSKFDVSDVMADNTKNPVFSQKPENLKECQKVGDPRSELMIVEGSSALGSLYKARSSHFQAIFPLRGKPLNTYDMSPTRLFIPPGSKNARTPTEKSQEKKRKKFLDSGHVLLQNRELDDLVKIIGAGFGESFDIDQMRYGKVIVVCDSDVDGGHIEALLIGFFYSYMPELVKQGRLYLACPPLFVVKVGKESDPEILLASNDTELEQLLTECRETGKKIIHVARRKGHGESDPEEVFEYITNPLTRKMKRITIEDATQAQDMMRLILSNDAAPRKEWISNPKTRSLVNLQEVS